MKNTILILIALASVFSAFGQGSEDARNFSQTFYQGTAKSMALSGAMGAIGADMTAICINPGSMGVYRSSELTMSTGLTDNFSSSTYYGNRESGSNKFGMNIPNLGFVLTNQRSNYGALRFTQFGIGLTRTNDYNCETFASGFNPSSSLMDNYLSQIPEGYYPPEEFQNDFPFTLFPAYETYLLDIDEDGYYTSPVPQGKIQQKQSRSFKGRSEEWTFAYSGNFNERFFLGASFGISHIKRIGTKIHNEHKTAESPETNFKSFDYTEDISSNATGVNLKVGAIYYLTTWMRLGLSYHTPTLYSFDESWKTITDANFIPNEYYNNHYSFSSRVSNYEYDLYSPQKLIGSMAFIIKHRGLIALDAEMMNYAKAKFDCIDYDYTSVNNEINDAFGRTLNLRLGTEWQYKNVYLRGGLAYYGSPYKFGDGNGSVKKASCGIGIQADEDVQFDFAYEFSHCKQQYLLYAYEGLEPINLNLNRSAFVVTMKIKF